MSPKTGFHFCFGSLLLGQEGEKLLEGLSLEAFALNLMERRKGAVWLGGTGHLCCVSSCCFRT